METEETKALAAMQEQKAMRKDNHDAAALGISLKQLYIRRRAEVKKAGVQSEAINRRTIRAQQAIARLGAEILAQTGRRDACQAQVDACQAKLDALLARLTEARTNA